METGARAAPSSPSLGEGSRLQEESDEAAAEEKCFTKESLPTTNVKVRLLSARPPARPPALMLACFFSCCLPCLLARSHCSPPYFQVRAQHNHSDCGLYMLKYIELLSEHRTPSSARWKAAPTKRQKEYNELKFSDVSIDEKRREMCTEIRRLGEEQRQLQEAIRASREEHAAGGPS